jgi:hypothetical protein
MHVPFSNYRQPMKSLPLPREKHFVIPMAAVQNFTENLPNPLRSLTIGRAFACIYYFSEKAMPLLALIF